MKLKSKKLAEQIAKLEAEHKSALAAEREADERELIRLVTQAHCLSDALVYARAKLTKRRQSTTQPQPASHETRT